MNTDQDKRDTEGETRAGPQHHTANHVDDAAPASWASMPRKRQLALLTVARVVETAANTSMQSFIFFQLQSFTQADGSAPSPATLALQVSVLNAVVAGPQLFTSVLWGRLADSPHVGRKSVVVVGLLGTGVGSLGMAFADSFVAVMLWRLLVGLVDGNRGAMRTMIKEIGGDKFESRAVLLLPTALNVGTVVGPLLGGILADPAAAGLQAFWSGGVRGGDTATPWLLKRPFALPNLFNGTCLVACAALLAFGLQETLQGVRVRPGHVLSKWAASLFGRGSLPSYRKLTEDDELDGRGPDASQEKPVRLWTPRLATTLLARGLLMMHIGAYPSLLLAFISTPRHDTGARSANPASAKSGHGPAVSFSFTGGLSFKPTGIATALAIRGIGGLMLQLLFFPILKSALGTVRLYRYSLLLFPLSYFFTPYLAMVSSSTAPPLPAAGALLWAAIALVLTMQTVARSFALPSSTMLLNAASPHPTMLGTVNGIGQSVTAAAKTVGPLLAGWLYGVGLGHGVVGVGWWALTAVAVLAAVAGAWISSEDGINGGRGRTRGNRRHAED